MNELFKEIYYKAEENLYKKGYIVSNMEYFKDEYEIFCEEREEVVIDHLSIAQLEQVAEIIKPNRYAK